MDTTNNVIQFAFYQFRVETVLGAVSLFYSTSREECEAFSQRCPYPTQIVPQIVVDLEYKMPWEQAKQRVWERSHPGSQR
jgi:hypothetical protein